MSPLLRPLSYEPLVPLNQIVTYEPPWGTNGPEQGI